MLSRLGGQLAHFKDKELSSVLTTANRHLRFLDTPLVALNTCRSTFDPTDLRRGKMTVYLILPPEHMRAQSALIRMWVGALFRSVVQGGLRPAYNVHAILDEAASLGPNMGCIEDAIDKYRGYGIRLQMYYQSPAQLKKCFPKDQDQTVMANMTQVFFGVNDTSAEYVSNRLGEQTIKVESGGWGTGSSSNTSHDFKTSSGTSSNSNRNWNLMGRKLLKPEEILSMSERIAITFVPGLKPIYSTLERYYEKTGKKAVLTPGAALIFSLNALLIMSGVCCHVWELFKGATHG
jgi:type IV secretion system protein VirD4